MIYPYVTLGDETKIVHSQILEENREKYIEVHFERATEDGFDLARCTLPMCIMQFCLYLNYWHTSYSLVPYALDNIMEYREVKRHIGTVTF